MNNQPMKDGKRIMPTGKCWCGCGKETKGLGTYFLQGHDTVAMRRTVLKRFGGVPQFLMAYGEEPGGSGQVASTVDAMAETVGVLKTMAANGEMASRLLRLVEDGPMPRRTR